MKTRPFPPVPKLAPGARKLQPSEWHALIRLWEKILVKRGIWPHPIFEE